MRNLVQTANHLFIPDVEPDHHRQQNWPDVYSAETRHPLQSQTQQLQCFQSERTQCFNPP